MFTKRIIPCLDIKNGRVVKGTNFVSLKDAGNPLELAKRYAKEGADELVFLDITATNEKRKTLAELVKKIAEVLDIPFCVGGGIGSVEDVKVMLASGADKVSINSQAVKNPDLINQIKANFGSQCLVVAIDVKYDFSSQKFYVHTHGGKQKTDLEAVSWAKEVYERGAGEILLTSMDGDGTKDGFDLEITKKIAEVVQIPVIASGGAGKISHFVDLFKQTKASAGLAASIFHFQTVEIEALKNTLSEKGVEIRDKF